MKDYEGKDFIFVGVFKGVVMVMVDFVWVLFFYVLMDWMVVLSYGVSMKFSGVV